MLENVRFFRNLFYRGFLIAFAMYIISCLIMFLFKDTSMAIVETYYALNKQEITMIMLSLMGMLKIFIMFFLLIPALTLHWTEKILHKNTP